MALLEKLNAPFEIVDIIMIYYYKDKKICDLLKNEQIFRKSTFDINIYYIYFLFPQCLTICFNVIIQSNIKFKMGPRHSKDSQLNFMKDYEIIQQNTNQNITFLQHKKTEEEYLLKEFNFNDKKQCQKTMEKLADLKTKLAGNKHVVPLKDYLMTSQDQYCSTFYKIYALFQYPQRTLDDQINQRKLHHKRFTETELWSILASCIVGLSHLQKNGIKHSALKSNNIIISREGIIKVSDPFAMGQLPNYDAALTKRSTQHVYLSPEQCQALQQQLINPNYNPFKSDIWTLGMIMLEAGLLQYQDEQCYRDEKSRIHWQTVQYNIDRLGQAYSDQIKNMVEFMLSRDERARPDWIDLEAHVMKGGDDVRRSFIQDQTKIEGSGNTFINSENSFTGVSNTQQPIGLNKRQTNITQVVQNQPPPVPNLPINRTSQGSDIIQNQFTPRTPQVVSYQNPQPVYYSRPQSPRVSQPMNPPVYHHNVHPGISHLSPPVQSSGNTIPVGNPILNNPTMNPTMQNVYHHIGNQQISHIPSSNPIANMGIQQSQIPPNIAPLKPSNIEQTRPNRNIFPADTYITKTKFDENLIIMIDDEEQGEQNESVPQMQQNNNIHQQGPTRVVTNNMRYDGPTSAQVHYINNSNQGSQSYPVQPQRYSSYSSPGQSDTYNTNQNRMMRPFTTTTANTVNGANVMYYQQPQQPQQSQPQQQPQPQSQQLRNIAPTVRQPSNGDSQFVIEEFKMGSRYEGHKLNGLRHGYGKFYYQDGGMYDGEWRQNKMEGVGKLYYQSGKLAYDGMWKNDQFMGKGVLHNQVPDMLNKPFDYNDFDNVDEYWTRYQGQFSDDMKNGRGVLFLSNGQKFQGNFVADNVQGPGTFFTKNGQRIVGNWMDNRKVG